MPPNLACHVARLGTIDYQQAWDLQIRLAQEVREGQRPNTLLLLEHFPVYTKGRLSRPEHVLLSPESLHDKGIPIIETDRGGQVTYHGPGQIVGYPVMNIKEWGGPLKYVRTLEQVIVSTLSDFQIDAGLVEGLTGVWVGDAKVAAIGVKISRGIAFHGFALNVNTDLTNYENIVPCGIEDRPVTSMARILNQPVDMEEVQYSLVYRFGQCMGLRMEEIEQSGSLAKLRAT